MFEQAIRKEREGEREIMREKERERKRVYVKIDRCKFI